MESRDPTQREYQIIQPTPSSSQQRKQTDYWPFFTDGGLEGITELILKLTITGEDRKTNHLRYVHWDLPITQLQMQDSRFLWNDLSTTVYKQTGFHISRHSLLSKVYYMRRNPEHVLKSVKRYHYWFTFQGDLKMKELHEIANQGVQLRSGYKEGRTITVTAKAKARREDPEYDSSKEIDLAGSSSETSSGESVSSQGSWGRKKKSKRRSKSPPPKRRRAIIEESRSPE
jgi:hypothetical protein